MKRTILTSRWFVLKCGYKSLVLYEGHHAEFKSSKILEGWYDIYINGEYNGTLPPDIFKTNFKVDPLLLENVYE